ncbi:hypothetical protein DXT97_01110 [Agrobacterium tumefaciens]|uniref:hypothetical protein n=1 Tax=Agrobacterium tumefaciens TaxID=358 RepID=UPI001296E549|nr:hypothetical protein [Agrobacterium tumefaciens]MQB35422.1 hypothetical protein [Agrobacterium tumefaciens]
MFTSEFTDEGEVDVQDFLTRLEDRGGSLQLLASAYWLSQPEVETFLFNDLPALLRNLGHGSRSSPPSIQPTFKGKVLWQETILGRLSGTVPRGRYVVAPIEKSADIPENQLLRLFLERVVVTSSEMMRRGNGSLPQRFGRIRDAALKALSNSYLQGVSAESRISARMLNTAIRHRDRRYARLAHLTRDFDAAVTRGKWGQILDLLRKGWLAPVSSDDLFELYALIIVMQLVERDMGFGPPAAYGLIQRGRSAVATFAHPECDIAAELFFDQVPSGIFGGRSEYLDVISAHEGIGGQERRPDIIIRFSTPFAERRLFMEVKETEDRVYMRDSVYKVLGYLRDFAGIWDDLTNQKPKAILFFPTGVHPHLAVEADMMIISSDRPADLLQAMARAMSGLMPQAAEEGN